MCGSVHHFNYRQALGARCGVLATMDDCLLVIEMVYTNPDDSVFENYSYRILRRVEMKKKKKKHLDHLTMDDFPQH